jgi:hypothetical protein
MILRRLPVYGTGIALCAALIAVADTRHWSGAQTTLVALGVGVFYVVTIFVPVLIRDQMASYTPPRTPPAAGVVAKRVHRSAVSEENNEVGENRESAATVRSRPVLTTLESKLAEVTGLAMAAQAAGGKVTKLTEDKDASLAKALQQMANEALEVEERCTELAGTFEGKKTAILDEAREVKEKASEMMLTYLDDDSDALDGFEFLTMAEAAEVGHWSVLRTLNELAGNAELRGLIEWALPIQERHFQNVLQGSQKLAKDSAEEASTSDTGSPE